MVKSETDEEEEEEETWDDDKDVEEKPVKKLGRPSMNRQPREEPTKATVSYTAFHQPERVGVANTKTGQPVGEDVMTLLALILTKLENIEEGVYGKNE